MTAPNDIGDSHAVPRVLVVSHLYPTPSRPWQCPWLEEQVAALASSAHMSVLCPSISAERYEHFTTAASVEVTCAPTKTPLGRGRLGLIGTSARYWSALTRHLSQSRIRIDLLHAHFGFPDAVLVERAAARARVPVVVTLHGDDAFHVARLRGPVGIALRRSLTRVDRVICVSREMRSSIMESVPEARSVVIENGYDDSTFQVADQRRSLDILFVGRLERVKNLDLLLEAFARAAKPDHARLVVAGTGSLRAELEQLARHLGISDSVAFVGQKSRVEVAELLRGARILALPSSSEGWGMAAAEALACGTPVVGSRVGGIPEIVASDDAGILVPPGDALSLAQALEDALSRTWDPTRVSTASGALPWSVQAAKIRAVYSEVLDERRVQTAPD